MEYITYHNHYIVTRQDGAVVQAWSDGPLPEEDTENAVCINDKGEYQFELFGMVNPPIRTEDMIPLYRWDGVNVIRRTEDEISAERAAAPMPPPDPSEKLRADVDFLLIMGGYSV